MAETNNKAKINSANGHRTSAAKNGANGKTVRRNSTTDGFSVKAENSMSEADKLTLRAWKKTFENQKKAA